MFENYAKEKDTDDTPVEVVIKDRNGEPYVHQGKQMVFHVVGIFSERYRQNDKRVSQALTRRAKRGAALDDDDAVDVFLERLSGGIVGWDNVVAKDGTPVPFNIKNAVALFKAADWILPQVKRVIDEHSSFFSGSSAPSAST